MGVKLEVFRMTLYLTFPVAMFWIANQAEWFEDYVIQRKRELWPPEKEDQFPEMATRHAPCPVHTPRQHSHSQAPRCPLSRLSEVWLGPACSEQRCSSIRSPCTWLRRLKKPSWSGEPAWGQTHSVQPGSQLGSPVPPVLSSQLPP
uniref:PET100 cytochrome c oxidase chaperone n=1 Tax=Equus caballus TaxID=9796 RepID=A0A9L0QZ92_HORSE